MAAPFSIGDLVELKIERLSYDGGRGVARYKDFVVFVGATAPDELVTAKITEIKKNFATAKLVQVVQASPHRRVPPCPVAGTCGGCPWQHINYAEQLKQKIGLVRFQLRKAVDESVLANLKIVTGEDEFRYRNRTQIHVQNQKYGFFAPQTNQLVETDDCLISDERLFANLKPELKKLPPATSPKPYKVELTLNNSGERVIRDLRTESSQFSQVNTAVNKKMVEYVVGLAQKILKQLSSPQSAKSEFSIYDLYCGSGNFTFPLAENLAANKINAKTVGVEENAKAIRKAEDDYLSLAPAYKMQFFSQDVGEFLNQLPDDANPTIFVLDPPRAGLSKVVLDQCLRLSPEALIYISCNLSTLARDLEHLRAAYRTVDLASFDMFPQTEYIETVCLLLPRDTP